MITIQRGIPVGQINRAAGIYHEAFQQKLQPILGTRDKATAVLEESLNPDYAFVALDGESLVGLVGFHDAQGQLVDIQYGTLLQHFGLLRGNWSAFLGILLSREPQPGEFLLDGIAVHADARGQGVGTRLFEAVFTHAAECGYAFIRLDVVDSNPRAQQLYERLGFVATKTEHVPFMGFMGFRAVTTMQYDLKQS